MVEKTFTLWGSWPVNRLTVSKDKGKKLFGSQIPKLSPPMQMRHGDPCLIKNSLDFTTDTNCLMEKFNFPPGGNKGSGAVSFDWLWPHINEGLRVASSD